jgi:hypothetical protein
MFGAYLCSLGPIKGVDRFAGAWLCTLTGSLPSPKQVFEQNLPSARRLQRTVLDRLATDLLHAAPGVIEHDQAQLVLMEDSAY